MSFTIAKATEADVPAILSLIKELAAFEREPDAVVVTEAVLLRDGFGFAPLYHCLVGKENGIVVGISFCYIRYSTWKGPRLYLEDLIVAHSARGKGYGSALFDATIELAKEMGCGAVCWQVLDWNTPAIDFYIKKGAVHNPGWLDMVLHV
jgi:GNAT superfamily N-acetyltransferase